MFFSLMIAILLGLASPSGTNNPSNCQGSGTVYATTGDNSGDPREGGDDDDDGDGTGGDTTQNPPPKP